jgi:hypothetical protein
MSNWLAKSTGIHISPHKTYFNGGEFKSGMGNLAKNVSPIAGALLGGPAGLALTAGLSGGGDLLRGKNIGQAIGGAIPNVGLAYGGQHVLSALGYGNAANQASSTAASSLTDGGDDALGAAERFGTQGTQATQAGDPTHLMGGLGEKLKAMPFQDKLALGSTALQGIGGVAGGIAQGQQNQFQRDQYNQMAPIRNQAMQQLGASMQAPQQFQFQSPFAQQGQGGQMGQGSPQMAQDAPGPQGQGLDPASQWAAILRARGLPGMQMGGR